MTSATYQVQFDSILNPDQTENANRIIEVEDASNAEEAQERAIDALEELGMSHGNILSITRLRA